jgi:hypothetical protein
LVATVLWRVAAHWWRSRSWRELNGSVYPATPAAGKTRRRVGQSKRYTCIDGQASPPSVLKGNVRVAGDLLETSSVVR